MQLCLGKLNACYVSIVYSARGPLNCLLRARSPPDDASAAGDSSPVKGSSSKYCTHYLLLLERRRRGSTCGNRTLAPHVPRVAER